MTIQDYNKRKQELDFDFRKKVNELMKEYIDSNNPYKIGDIITDHIGSIKIESINYTMTFGLSGMEAIYIGLEFKKDGTLGKERFVYQTDIIK
jgi:hypothetical protein